MEAELEMRVREQLDRAEIWRVMQNYARGLDRLDHALVRACYWDDAIEDHGDFVGSPDEFIGWANQATLCFQSAQHGLLNHYCDLQGTDAFTETYYLFSAVTGAQNNFMATGRYVDHFQKRGDKWKIVNRVRVLEGKYDVPASIFGNNLMPCLAPQEFWQSARDSGDVSYHRPLVPRQSP